MLNPSASVFALQQFAACSPSQFNARPTPKATRALKPMTRHFATERLYLDLPKGRNFNQAIRKSR